MAHVIKVELSEAGQRAALLAGEPAQKEQEYELTVDLLPRALALGAVVHPDGSVTLRPRYAHHILDARPANAAAAVAAFEAAEAKHIAEQVAYAAEQAAAKAAQDRVRAEECDAIVVQLTALSDEHLAQAWAQAWLKGGYSMAPTAREIATAAKIDTIHADLIEPRVVGVTAVVRVLLATQAAETERAVAARRAELRAVLEMLSPPDQLERFDAGVLPEAELEALIEEYLFTAFDLPHYEKLTEDDLEHEAGCGCDHKFKAEAAENHPLTSQQWTRLKALQAIVAKVDGASLQVRAHTAYCTDDYRDCTAHTVRLGVRVEIEFAGDTYTGEFAL